MPCLWPLSRCHFYVARAHENSDPCGHLICRSPPSNPLLLGQEPFPMPLADSIKRTAELFTALKNEGRLTDKDLE